MITWIKLILELINLFKDYKTKQGQALRKEELIDAIKQAREKKNTKMLERFFNPDSAAVSPSGMWTAAKKQAIVDKVSENNRHKAVGDGWDEREND